MSCRQGKSEDQKHLPLVLQSSSGSATPASLRLCVILKLETQGRPDRARVLRVFRLVPQQLSGELSQQILRAGAKCLVLTTS